MTRCTGLLAVLAMILVGVGLSGCAQSQSGLAGVDSYHAAIRRTALGIPHIEAADWGGLGYGYGYVQAQDNLCTMADAFVTFRGERSANFGADARPSSAASFEQPRNLDADFFFRLVDDQAALERFRSAQAPRLRELIDGFASGYNRYLGELNAGRFPDAHAACRGKPWVTPISTDDIYRRLIAANLAGGAALFVAQTATAHPPDAAALPQAENAAPASLKLTAASFEFAGRTGIGSNALAFGAHTTRDGASLLFGNPHWFWGGPDRFYQAQLTIPGKLNVAGVSFLGMPVVMMGFNGNIAWTHTVSAARRFGIFQLTLLPGDPTRYLIDGRAEDMSAVSITVQTRSPDGSLIPVTRKLYRSRFGPLLDLSSLSPALAWNNQHAFALRDVNADNSRVFENFLEWGEAHSLDDFIAIQKRLAATPWVNTFAIGRNDPRVWFADIGAMPNVPDALAQTCTPPLGRAFDAQVPGVPFLDGSKSACNWLTVPDAPQFDGLPVSRMPALIRHDYVANFNGGYWLTNAHAPLTGYPQVAGATGEQQSLRTRLGHALAADLLSQAGGVSREMLEKKVFDNRSMSEELLRKPLLEALCMDPVEAAAGATQGSRVVDASAATQRADLQRGCEVLRAWDGSAAADARGANLWDEFWQRAGALPEQRLYSVPFDQAEPLTTPSGLNSADPAVIVNLRKALGDAVRALRQAGFAADSKRGDLLYTQRAGRHVPLYGGCDMEGYFMVVCPQHKLDNEAYSMDRNGHGASYLQVVSFDSQGVEADTMLAHSESDDPASKHFADATWQFARQSWLRFPFTEQAIASDPEMTREILDGH